MSWQFPITIENGKHNQVSICDVEITGEQGKFTVYVKK